MNRRTWLALTGPAIATLAAPVWAQFGGRRGSRGPQEGRKGGDGGAKGQERVNQLEVTLNEFHEDLKLTPAQEPAWESYADKVRALAGDVAKEQAQRGAASTLSVLQRIERTTDIARNRFTALEDIAQAAKALYSSLTPEQQAVSDPRLATIVAAALTPAMPPGMRGAGDAPRRPPN
ncbi:MAG TPA: Spy/CpxP family protein refolding chaperone [Burkholderiales bacterium]|nr:Spy/CpxP family protein refolding chaperone [Burkholderiales bacterium]